jgi:hypothetical protein
MKLRLRSLVVVAICASGVLAACGSTTVVDVSTTTSTLVGETTTLPVGTVTELLPRLRDAAFTLSPAIDDGTSREVFGTIDDLWSAVKAQLPHTTFVDDVQHQVDLMSTAVDRKRPGDADKAAVHLRMLIDAYRP